jgi:hypothetical protein
MMALSDPLAGNDWNAHTWKAGLFHSTNSIPPHFFKMANPHLTRISSIYNCRLEPFFNYSRLHVGLGVKRIH